MYLSSTHAMRAGPRSSRSAAIMGPTLVASPDVHAASRRCSSPAASCALPAIPSSRRYRGWRANVLRIGNPAANRRRVEARFQRSQGGVWRGGELAVRDLRGQRLAALEIGKHERGAGAPVLRAHFRSGLSRGELAKPAQYDRRRSRRGWSMSEIGRRERAAVPCRSSTPQLRGRGHCGGSRLRPCRSPGARP